MYGVENVRGGIYSLIDLPTDTIDLLKKEIATAQNKCYICNKSGHIAIACTEKKKKNLNNLDDAILYKVEQSFIPIEIKSTYWFVG